MRCNWKIEAWRLALGVVSAGLLLCQPPTDAAERLVIREGPWEGSLKIHDLRRFAETGEASPELNAYLQLMQQHPEIVQLILTQPLPIDGLSLDRLLNSPLGELMLDQMGEIVHTSVKSADRQALRSALVLAARGNDGITLLKVLEQYPTPEVIVESDRLEPAYRRISSIATRFREISPWLDLARSLVQPILGN